MKESVATLRACFIILGALGVWASFWGVLLAMGLFAFHPIIGMTLLMFTGPSFLMSIAYIGCGVMLPQLLKTNPKAVTMLLMARMVLAIGSFAICSVSGIYSINGLFNMLVAVGVSYYLLGVVRRVSAQQQ